MQSSQSKRSPTSRFLTGVLIIIFILIVFAALFYMSGIPFFNGWLPCYPPPWVSVDGAVKVEVYAFYDANQNGSPDEGERSLPNIEASLGEKTKITNQEGKTTLYLFKEGCACKCGKNESVSIQVPLSWEATTPTIIRLKESETQVNFGLIKP